METVELVWKESLIFQNTQFRYSQTINGQASRKWPSSHGPYRMEFLTVLLFAVDLSTKEILWFKNQWNRVSGVDLVLAV